MYVSDTKNGEDIVRQVKDNLANYFEQKTKAAEVSKVFNSKAFPLILNLN